MRQVACARVLGFEVLFPLAMSAPERPPSLDPVAAARWSAHPVGKASPWLHEEVASRMVERLQWINLQPKAWTHWGAVRGGQKAHFALLEKYPKALCFMPVAGKFIADTAIKNIAAYAY